MTPNDDLRNRVSEGKNCKIAWIGLMLGSTYLFFVFTGIKCDLPDMPSLPDIPSFPSSQSYSNYQTEGPKSNARERKEIRVQVDPVEWSEWIRISPNCRWEVDRPGTWEEYLFSDGVTVRSDPGTHRNVGVIPGNKFKLRGSKGEVVIEIYPK